MKRIRKDLTAAVLLLLCCGAQSRPQKQSFVTTTTDSTTSTEELVIPEDEPKPTVTSVDIRSDIQFRYARTVVKTTIKNPSVRFAQQATFEMVLPNKAFISNFTIEVKGDDKVYVAKVAEKAKAQAEFDKAVSSGQSAGLVEARDADQIKVSANVEPAGKLTFTLTYEELLRRHSSRYEQVIHVNPGQVVKDYKVNVYINESLPVINLNVPELKTSPNEIDAELEDNPIALINTNVDGDPNMAHVAFSPDVEHQQSLGGEDGMSGQFIVRYDVDRKAQGGNEIHVLDGYFVHFFAPDTLETLPRHVVFVLDVSGSMSGRKLEQTKDAMVTILDGMTDQDSFNFLTFSDDVYHWEPEKTENKEGEPKRLTHRGTKAVRKAAKKHAQSLETIAGTNINDALLAAIDLIKRVKLRDELTSNTKPMIIFLTDGQASTGVTSNDAIKRNVLEANKDIDIPIYSLAFGRGADFRLTKDLSLESSALSRRIYEDSDAAIQLEDFLLEISSPLLKDLKFKYVGESFQNTTEVNYNIFYRGCEYVIAGTIRPETEEVPEIVIQGQGKTEMFESRIRPCLYDTTAHESSVRRPPPPPPTSVIPISTDAPIAHPPTFPPILPPPICIPIVVPRRQERSQHENFIERLWAYLTIKDLLKDQKSSEKQKDSEELEVSHSKKDDEPRTGLDLTTQKPMKPKTRRERALDLALKYNFVTELTSLVVVKPDKPEGDVVEPEPISYGAVNPYRHTYAYAAPPGPPGSYNSYSSGVQLLSAGAPPRRPTMRRKSRPTVRHRTTTRQKMTTTFPAIIAFPAQQPSYAYYDAAEEYDLGDYEPETTTTEDPQMWARATCVARLFAKTYLREAGPIFDKTNGTSVDDLTDFDFDDQLTSMKVEGPCCVLVYTEPNFKGSLEKFSEGEYKSVSKLGDVLGDASSLKIIQSRC